MLNRIAAACLALCIALAPVAGYPNDLANSSWSETDSSNNAASPNGWTSGTMLPSQVEPTARAMMGAIKRWHDQISAVVTSAGTNTITLTHTVGHAAYVTGDIFTFIAGGTNTGSATLNVDALGAKTIKQAGANLVGNEIQTGDVVTVAYDGTNMQLIASSRRGMLAALSDVTAPTSWTPGLDFGGGTTGITYSLQAGSYTKIGKLVVAQFQITLTNKGSSTGTAHLTGLPVTSAATANLIGMVTITGVATMNAGPGTLTAQIGPGSTTAAFSFWTSGGTSQISDANFNNNSSMNGTAIYISQ